MQIPEFHSRVVSNTKNCALYVIARLWLGLVMYEEGIIVIEINSNKYKMTSRESSLLKSFVCY